ncbi:MAG: helicase-exonuclease AddAB subunit AddA [Planctomycetes bacterium]|nr:helicase-exonuclease AddAB subunit AddA [Planctomycetota bacterium]
MAEFAPTPAQHAAIHAVGQSVVVSAGAGSGKTAVLAERCAHLVADQVPPCGVESLLVVTFTDASAMEMRERIEKTLRARLAASPGERWLQEQIALLDTATISTLHSFCRRVLNRYFAAADLDPQAPVMDAHDAEILRRETATTVLNRLTGEDGAEAEAMLDLLAHYAGTSEDRLLDAALELHAFLASVIDRDRWVQACAERLTTTNGDVPVFWLKRFREGLRGELEQQIGTLDGYLAALDGEVFPFTEPFRVCLGSYRNAVEELLAELAKAKTAKALDALCERIQAWEFGKIPPKERNKEMPPAFSRSQEHAKTARDTLLKRRLQGTYGTFRSASVADGIIRTQPHLRAFLRLVEAIAMEYDAAKRELGVVDFSDLERKTLDLLCDESNGVAARLRDQYRFVLVDEYQDINPVQAEILQRVSREAETRASNLFTVGDVKQSIYRFRLAEPEIFLRRLSEAPMHESAADDARTIRIDLLENFRSRPGVIDSANVIFERLMAVDLGNIAYDEHARLRATRGKPEGRAFPPVELHILEAASRGSDADEQESNEADAMDWEQIEREAFLTADRIAAIVAGGVPYSDIVILLRSMQPRAGLFIRTLNRRGIPVYADAAGGMFDHLEIIDILGLLALLDNRQQDIPLAGLLRSPLMGEPLGDDELASIRIAARGLDTSTPFHEAVSHYAVNGSDASLRDRVFAILERLDEWRRRIRRRPLADVLWEIYESTGYLAHVAALRDGPQRRANLLRLHEYARQFGAFNRQGLNRFLRFIDALRQNERDLEPGQASSAAGDAVRVMTIHRSKGLEFPVVFVCELGKRFNFADAQGNILFDRELGLAMSAVDLERRITWPTLPHRIVSQAVKRESLAEELRVLYVALTRARERLVLVGTGKIDDVDTALKQWAGHTGPLPLFERQSAQSVLDWMIPAVCSQAASLVAVNKEPEAETLFAVTTRSHDEMRAWSAEPVETADHVRLKAAFAALERVGDATAEADVSVIRTIERRLFTPYAAERLTRVPSVAAASVLKRRWNAMADEDEPTGAIGPTFGAGGFAKPSFVSVEVAPNQVGTWTHEFLQRVDLARPCDEGDLRGQLAACVASGVLSDDEAGRIDVPAIAWFFVSELGRRVRASAKVKREWPFVIGVEPTRYDPQATPRDASDVMLVRGMIDCLFDAGEGWEILDYKTDNVRGDAVQARADEYRGQVQIYARAVEAAWGKPVKRRWLAFLSAREVVET